MKGPLLTRYRLHPALMLALDAATAQAREWKQDYLGVEHLLLGILESENPDGPGLAAISLLGVTPEMVHEKLVPVASEVTDRRVPRVIPFTPRSLLVLDSAADLARKERLALVDAGHVMHAIMEERESLAAWALAEACADQLTELPPVLPPLHRAFLEWALVAHGAAWEVPWDAESAILEALQKCGRNDPAPPDLRLTVQSFAINRWFASARVSAMHSGGKVRLVICPGANSSEARRSRHQRLAARICRHISAVPDAIRISRHSFMSNWPETLVDRAGRLERSRFSEKLPSGCLRAWQISDEAASFKLFQSLEQSGQIPSGHFPNYLGSLRDSDGITLVIEDGGALAGTATAFVRAAEHRAGEPPALSLAFGLVLPERQGRALGLTLIAARLWLAVYLQRKYVHLEATARSRPWLDRLGFRFILHTIETGTFYHGSLLLDDDDGGFLEAWLGSERTAFLIELATRFQREDSPDCSEETEH